MKLFTLTLSHLHTSMFVFNPQARYFNPNLLITNQIRALSQSFNHQIMPLDTTIDILHVISGGLEVRGCVVTLGDEDVVVEAAF